LASSARREIRLKISSAMMASCVAASVSLEFSDAEMRRLRPSICLSAAATARCLSSMQMYRIVSRCSLEVRRSFSSSS